MIARVLPFYLALFPVLMMYSNRGTVLALALLFLAASADACRGGWRMPLSRPVALSGAAFLTFALSSMLWEEWPGMAMSKGAAIAGVCLGGMVVLGVVRGAAGDSRRLLGFATLGMVMAGVLMLIETATHMAVSHAIADWQGAPVPVGAMSPTKFKPAAAVLGIWGSVLVGLHGQRGQWLGIVVNALVIVLITYFSSSLAGLLAMAAAMIAAAMALYGGMLGWRLLMVAAIALVMGAPLITFLPGNEKIVEIRSLPNSTIHRLSIWEYGMGKAMQRPVLGWGLDAARQMDVSAPVKLHLYGGDGHDEQVLSLMPLHPHNSAVQVWLELGGVGAVLSSLLLAALLWAGKGHPKVWRSVFAAGMFSALAVGMVSVGAWQSWWLSSLWLIVILAKEISLSTPRLSGCGVQPVPGQTG